MRKDRRQAALHRVATRRDMLIAISIAVGVIAVFGVLATLIFAALDMPLLYPLLLTIATLMIYAAALVVWWFIHKHRNRAILDYSITTLLDSPVGRVIQKMSVPVVACDDKWLLFWYNEALEKVFRAAADGDNAEQWGQGSCLPFRSGSDYLELAGHTYRAEKIQVSSENKKYQFFVLVDCTDLLAVQKAYHNERTSVAYIVIDSVEEMTQYVSESVRDALGQVDDTLKDWVSRMNGVLRSYDNDKYIALLDTEQLEACIDQRFSVLDEIRSIRVGDGVSITVSMGISNVEGSLEFRQKQAQSALDMALQRGGDQVVYKSDKGVEFFGGRTKAVCKRSNVKARAISAQISSMICRATNVVIMGHARPDFDSFAACVGVAKLADACNVPYHIVVDKGCKTIVPCLSIALDVPYLRDKFISAKEGIERIKNDTLLIVCDVNNFAISESNDVAKKARTIVVIDHHIKKEELPATVKLSYIEPTASSASELVTELLEHSASLIQLVPEEAELLLGGILLDTQQFRRNTGTRTFAVAQYLRGQGADTTSASNMFRDELTDLIKEANFLSSVKIYDEIAIATFDNESEAGSQVLASKVADKLLTIKGVEASFALIRMKNSISISGRSHGHINVQLILEELKGGGHYDSAGAQVETTDMTEALALLRKSIEKFKENKH